MKYFDIIRSVSESGHYRAPCGAEREEGSFYCGQSLCPETGNITLEGKAKDLLEDDSIKKAYLGE